MVDIPDALKGKIVDAIKPVLVDHLVDHKDDDAKKAQDEALGQAVNVATELLKVGLGFIK